MRRPWKIAAVAYVGLLAVSHLYRAATPTPRFPFPGQSIAEMAAVEGGRRLPGRTVEIAYRDHVPGGRPGAPVLVLLHGSPVASQTFDALVPHLEGRFRLVVPDLFGFGGSTPDLPDYSMVAAGTYVVDLLEKIGSGPVHYVAYSQSGGVALHAHALAPERTASLTLLSSVGVQELELLGDHTLNHGLYALQLALVSLVQEATPHFGWMDNAIVSRKFARSFFDSDQRPLRGMLEAFAPPALIVHGRDDVLVPFAAAEEHARIMPHAELAPFDGGHGLVFREPAKVAGAIAPFVEKVEAGGGVARAKASAARKALAELPFHAKQLSALPGGIAIVMVLLAMATLVSEDLTCLSAGLLVAKGVLGFAPATAGCLLGIFVGDLCVFFMGRHFGARAAAVPPLSWVLPHHRLERGRAWFEENGTRVIFATRFLPGTRLATYFSAGASRVRLGKFLPYFLLSAALWTPMLVGVSALLGGPALAWFERFGAAAAWALVATLSALWLLFRLAGSLSTWRGRRLLLGRWRRLARWEFWPPYVFYPPVVAYVLWLALRHRALNVFTAANPDIPCGGLVLESKAEIMDAMASSGAVAPFARIGSAAELDAFSAAHPPAFPVVLKPDVGERGQGVAVVRTRAEAAAYLAACPDPVIAQKFVPGPEFGVFYARHPDEPAGRVIALTEKRFPSVTGDGSRTLEELILADERAVCMARFFLTKHEKSLSDVLPPGETLALTELGTHCRGALFLDGTRHITPALEAAVDRLSKHFEGFHFGRYDIRVPSLEALRDGRDLTVLELNGVSSEPTNIYDPAHGLVFAYRTLFRTWRLCFAIGAANVARGCPATPVREIVRRIRRFRHQPRFEAPAPAPLASALGRPQP